MKYGVEQARIWTEASGTRGVNKPGHYHEYTDADGRVVARFLWSSPVYEVDRSVEYAWVEAGCPLPAPGCHLIEPEHAVDVPEPAAFEPLTEPSKAATVTDEGSLLLSSDEGVAPETVAAPETLDQGNW